MPDMFIAWWTSRTHSRRRLTPAATILCTGLLQLLWFYVLSDCDDKCSKTVCIPLHRAVNNVMSEFYQIISTFLVMIECFIVFLFLTVFYNNFLLSLYISVVPVLIVCFWRINVFINFRQSSSSLRMRASTALTLWHPLLPYGYSYKASCTVLDRPWASECPDVKNYKWRLNPTQDTL